MVKSTNKENIQHIQNQINILRKEIEDIKERLIPLQFPDIPTYILVAQYNTEQSVVVAGKVFCYKQKILPSIVYYPTKTTQETKDQVIISMILDMIYNVCCESVLQREQRSILLEQLDNNNLDLLTVCTTNELKERAQRLKQEMKNVGVHLQPHLYLQPQLFKLVKEQIYSLLKSAVDNK